MWYLEFADWENLVASYDVELPLGFKSLGVAEEVAVPSGYGYSDRVWRRLIEFDTTIVSNPGMATASVLKTLLKGSILHHNADKK